MSIALQISELHKVFCEVTGRDLLLSMACERFWFNAVKDGLKPHDLRAVLIERQAAIKRGDRRPACLLLRNICGSEEAILDCLDEASAIKALKRSKIIPSAKADVLRSTGRPAFYEDKSTLDPNMQNAAQPVSYYINALRKATE